MIQFSNGDKTPIEWEDIPEDEFIFSRFRVDATLTVAGNDFSTMYIPILDFALAWASAPIVLEMKNRVVLPMSVEALTYAVENDENHVRIFSNVHRGRVSIPRNEFNSLVDKIVGDAFELLFVRHPQLRQNHYLIDLQQRLERLAQSKGGLEKVTNISPE
jgi:hypothetical protein